MLKIIVTFLLLFVFFGFVGSLIISTKQEDLFRVAKLLTFGAFYATITTVFLLIIVYFF